MILASCRRLITAPVEAVWALVSTAEGLDRWMSVSAEVDLRPGGAIRWVHDNGWVVAGEIREVEAPHRLVFTFGWERGGFPVPAGSTLVSIELAPAGDGTEVEVRHTGLTEPMAEQHQAGWAMFVDRLAAVAERADPEAEAN